MSNSLDPSQTRHFVGPDLDPNCLQRLSADEIRRLRVIVHRNKEIENMYMYLVSVKCAAITQTGN